MIDYADPNRIPLPQSIWARMALWMARNAAAAAVGTVLALGTLGITFASFRSPLISSASVLATIVLSTILARAMQINRRARAMLILEYVAQSVRLGMPLPEMLRASSLAERRPTSKRLLKLAGAIESGISLGDALHGAVPEMPRRAVGLVATASRTNSLVETVARLVEHERVRIGRDAFRATFQRIYALLTILLICGAIALFGIFVLPKFRQIFKDFRIPLPWQANVVYSTAEQLAPILFVVAGLGVLWIYVDAWHDTFDPRARRWNLLRNWRDRIKWMLPIFGNAARDRGMADVCFALAAALKVGMPLQTALLEVGWLDVNHVLRRRLLRWSQFLARGDDIASAARRVRLPALLTGMLTPGIASVALPEVFEFLAAYYNARAERALAILQAALVPAVALVAGATIVLLYLSVFRPMIMMCEKVMP